MQTRSSFRRLAVVLLVALAAAGLPAAAHAQATRGTILGTITDQTGAAGSQITLLKFDLAKLPANAVVNKATLELTQSDASGADAYSIEPDVLRYRESGCETIKPTRTQSN